jgi:hypothetical protein
MDTVSSCGCLPLILLTWAHPAVHENRKRLADPQIAKGRFADTVGDPSEDQDCRDVDCGSSAWSAAKLVVQ